MIDRPKRIQMSRHHKWRLDHPDAVIVSRGTGQHPFANPYEGDGTSKDHAYLVQIYADFLARPEQAELVAKIKSELRGKDLACWCALDQPCHVDVLLEVANGETRAPDDGGTMGPEWIEAEIKKANTMNDAFKPCPYCGSEEVYITNQPFPCVYCKSCDASGTECDTLLEATTAWNRRTDADLLADPRVQLLVEAAERAEKYIEKGMLDRSGPVLRNLRAALAALRDGDPS